MEKVLFVGIGGFIGTSLRYITSNHFNKIFSSFFPYGTLAVNLIGCFLLGLGLTFAKESHIISENTALLLFTGLLGGFTTYSTFSFESFDLFRNGFFHGGLLNLLLHVFLGLFAVWLGYVSACKLKYFF